MQRLRSLRHRFWYGVSERVAWTRGAFHETPALRLPELDFEQAQRIAALQCRYQVQFEQRLSAATSINNYEYLDMLDRAWDSAGLARPGGGVVCDVGCASFWYAAAWQSFFRPQELVGVEVEGHRLFRDGRTRRDYAAGYLADLPHARFVVADYLRCELPADVITAWFPFVAPAAILAWRLPLSLLTPERLFRHICHNLGPGGRFLMANHGHPEAALAQRLCAAAGLRLLSQSAACGVLSAHRASPAVVSCWTRPEGTPSHTPEQYSY
jgi:SAM-dependent methyltransferase